MGEKNKLYEQYVTRPYPAHLAVSTYSGGVNVLSHACAGMTARDCPAFLGDSAPNQGVPQLSYKFHRRHNPQPVVWPRLNRQSPLCCRRTARPRAASIVISRNIPSGDIVGMAGMPATPAIRKLVTEAGPGTLGLNVCADASLVPLPSLSKAIEP